MDEEAYGGVGLLAMLLKLPSVAWVPPLWSYPQKTGTRVTRNSCARRVRRRTAISPERLVVQKPATGDALLARCALLTR